MARRTKKILGVRAKVPRADYLEQCAEMRSVIMDAALQKITELVEDIAIVQKVNADALTSTLPMLVPAPVDRPFSAFFDGPSSHRPVHKSIPLPSPVPPAAPPPPLAQPPVPAASQAPARRAFASFAPSPPRKMELKMEDCLTFCAQALARRNGPLSIMKSECNYQPLSLTLV